MGTVAGYFLSPHSRAGSPVRVHLSTNLILPLGKHFIVLTRLRLEIGVGCTEGVDYLAQEVRKFPRQACVQML